jgi:hypothetical protein
MESNAGRLLHATARYEGGDSRLDDVMLVGLAFRESYLDGRTYLEAYGVDAEGERVALVPPRIARGTAAERVALFASLLLRGLRVRVSILVDHAGCDVLRSRIAAAWGTRAVFLEHRGGRRLAARGAARARAR